MWEVLRDPIWDGIGAAIGLIGVVAAIILAVAVYRLQRRRKELGYRVLSQSRVASVEADLDDKLVIMYDGERVADVHLVMLELVNSGNQPIIPDDYLHPLQINLGEGARVLTAEQVGSEPEGIPASPSITESLEKVRVDPVLLNAGDSFTLKILVARFGGTVDFDARIVGVKEIRVVRAELSKAERATLARVTTSAGFALMVMILCGVIALLEGSWLSALLFCVLALTAIPFYAGVLAPALSRAFRRWRGSHHRHQPAD